MHKTSDQKQGKVTKIGALCFLGAGHDENVPRLQHGHRDGLDGFPEASRAGVGRNKEAVVIGQAVAWNVDSPRVTLRF